MRGQRHSPAPGKTRYLLYRRLGGPQGRSGQARKISPPPGFDTRTVQPLASRFTDWATRPTGRINESIFYFLQSFDPKVIWNMMPCHCVITSRYKGPVHPRRLYDLWTLCRWGRHNISSKRWNLPSGTALHIPHERNPQLYRPEKPKNSWEKINFDLCAINNPNCH